MLLTPPPFENSDTTRTSFRTCDPSQGLCPLGAEQFASPWRNQKPTSFVPLSLFFSSAKYMSLSPSLALVYAAEYAFMMSILLLTLLSWLHSHPVMSKVSLLPVANVVSSPVQNLVDVLVSEQAPGFAPDWKSRVKVALVNGPVELITELLVTVSFPPALATLKMSAQSFWLELQNDPPAQLVAV